MHVHVHVMVTDALVAAVAGKGGIFLFGGREE